MRAWSAVLFTVVLLAICYTVSAVIYFDLTWILIWITSLWAGIDSAKIGLSRYKLGIACRPVPLFCLCALLWIFTFPWYLWERHKIKNGTAILKDETTCGLEPRRVKKFTENLSKIVTRVGEWILIAVVGLKIIFLIICLEENLRGQRAWYNYRRELEAKGEMFDWETMIPPPVPDSQNIFSAPMISQWFVKPADKALDKGGLADTLKHTNNSPKVLIARVTVEPVSGNASSATTDVALRLDDPQSRQRAKKLFQSIAGLCVSGARGEDTLVVTAPNLNGIKPLHFSLEADKKPTARELTAFFSDNNDGSGSFAIKPDGANSFQVLTSFVSASDYLAWSDKFKGDFELMRQALKRPHARIKGNYRDPQTIPVPNYVTFRAVAQTLVQRAQCYLILGEPEKALQELTLVHDLPRLLENAPTGKPMTLASAMMISAVLGIYVDAIADGFRLHSWQEPQLGTLEKQLSEINLAPLITESIHYEQVSAWTFINSTMASLSIPRIPNATLGQKIKNLRPPNILRGFFDLNVVTIAEMQQQIIDSIDLVRKTVAPQNVAEFQKKEAELGHHFSPYTFFAQILVPDYSKAVQKFAFIQTKVDEAQIVCALERYRIINGRYPEGLGELVPQFIEKLPHDMIGGEPLKYQRTSDGQFTLYSIGWNEKDDAGYVSLRPFEYDNGDWVWQ